MVVLIRLRVHSTERRLCLLSTSRMEVVQRYKGRVVTSNATGELVERGKPRLAVTGVLQKRIKKWRVNPRGNADTGDVIATGGGFCTTATWP